MDYDRTGNHAKTASRWKFLTRLEKGGHRLFKDEETGRVSFADNSGRTPDDTEDGPLWLNERQQLVIQEPKSGSTFVSVEVEDDRGRRTAFVGVGWDGALKLADMFSGIAVNLTTRGGRTFPIT